MIVRIDQTRHDHLAVQIDNARLLADVRLHALVRTDIDDATRADCDRLLDAVAVVDSVDESSPQHRVCGRGCPRAVCTHWVWRSQAQHRDHGARIQETSHFAAIHTSDLQQPCASPRRWGHEFQSLLSSLVVGRYILPAAKPPVTSLGAWQPAVL